MTYSGHQVLRNTSIRGFFHHFGVILTDGSTDRRMDGRTYQSTDRWTEGQKIVLIAHMPWDFKQSPLRYLSEFLGWVQIKCELRILSNFAFNLQQDWELPPKKDVHNPLKEGVRDMLVKHHLFSWDL